MDKNLSELIGEYKIKCLTLNDNDTLVLKSSDPISDKESQLIQDKLALVFGDVKILVLDNRLDFFVIKDDRKEENELNLMGVI